MARVSRTTRFLAAFSIVLVATVLLLHHAKPRGALSQSDALLAAREAKLRVWEEALSRREAALVAERAATAANTLVAPDSAEVDIGSEGMTLSLLCPVIDGKLCFGHGQCSADTGRCSCTAGFAGRGCSIALRTVRADKWDENESALADLRRSGTALADFMSVAILRAQGEADNSARISRLRSELHKWAPALDVRTVSVDAVASTVAAIASEFVLLLAADVDQVGEDAALDTFLSLLLTTDVDVLGFMVARRSPLRARHVGLDGDDVLLPGTRNLDVPCYDFMHKQWQLRHVVPAFGYQRHERYVMYCDRTSDSFAFRPKLFAEGNGFAWPESSRLDVQRIRLTEALNAAMASMFHANVFASIHVHNSALRRHYANETLLRINRVPKNGIASLALIATRAPTRLPGVILVGTCAECVIGTNLAAEERLNAAFAERYQVEMYHDRAGRASAPVCVKTGGIYGHSQRGLYSPICHRFQRQRDFLVLADAWLDPNFAPLPRVKEAHQVFGISLHHGNLFGALRFREELLWETDGDIDFVGFNATHEQLMRRWEALIRHAESKHGFLTKMNYPEKPWYVQFTRDKTDFQCNARSPLDPATRGKPPQRHSTSVDYQGRRVFMNGFSNPWRGIRTDPGHDYRGKYLAQQGWVLQFTKKSISCRVPGHNACLPDCNDRWSLFDHNRCHDDVGAAIRNPVLQHSAQLGRTLDVSPGEHDRWVHMGLF